MLAKAKMLLLAGVMTSFALEVCAQADNASQVAAHSSAPASEQWLQPALTYDAGAVADLRGGARRGVAYVGNLHLMLTAKGDSMGWPGTSAFVDLLGIQGGRQSRLVGDAQGTSHLEGPPGAQVEELWLQHNAADNRVSLLLGIYDVNSEFYRLEAAGLFQNSSFGIGPEFGLSGVEGPSIFPRTSLGLRLAVKPTADTVLRAAVLDGVPVARADGSHAVFRRGDGLLTVAEFAWLSRGGSAGMEHPATRNRIGRLSSLQPYEDKLAFGAWCHTGKLADLNDVDGAGDAVLHRGSYGAYAVAERSIIGNSTGPGPGLAAFAQIGFADVRTNRFGRYLGAGLVGTGMWGMGDGVQVGLSFAHARNGMHYAESMSAARFRLAETAFELSYLRRLTKQLSLLPDLQYVVRPNSDPSLANALVLTIRLEMAI